jgi:enoyl-CoA hydratase
MTGNMIDASIALDYGLVNHLVPQEELLAKTHMLLDAIVSKAPIAIRHCITAANAVFGSENGFELEIELFGSCFESEDMKEGTTAFLEKRKAKFTGK